MKKIENNSLTSNNIGEKVELFGWVHKKRNLGGMLFIDLRDRSGIVQLVIKPDNKYYKKIENIKVESVIKIIGIVLERENKNPSLPTGDIEVIVEEIIILNSAEDIPFEISSNTTALEDTRLKYRYLDLRRNNLLNNLTIRHKIMMITRNYFNDLGFLEIETPILCKSTPEGARDYLVPSRVNKGKYYALPQSPQIFKQLLMVGGIEKYFQVAKCFRDEDLRADRQPEFTQIDMEMSFIEEEDIMLVTENLLSILFKQIKNIEIPLPIKKITYEEAIKLYGSDKPDLRFDMKIEDLTAVLKENTSILFKDKIINGLVVRDKAEMYSRKDLELLTEYIKQYKLDNLYYLKYNNKELSGSINKILSDGEREEIIKYLNLNDNDLVLIVADNYQNVKSCLGNLRLRVGRDCNLIKDNNYELLWVTDFPMFEYDQDEKRYYALHHPFTAPKENLDSLKNSPDKCLSKTYDIVINGYEAGGGSIRIHQKDIQEQVFKTLGITNDKMKEKFGFMLEAFKYGTPPHGGIALGLDRLTMILSGTDNIRDVIAFPKTASASCLMSDAPNLVEKEQLEILGIK